MKALCLDAAQAIVKKIKAICELENKAIGQDVKDLTDALSTLDNIIYAEREAERGEKE